MHHKKLAKLDASNNKTKEEEEKKKDCCHYSLSQVMHDSEPLAPQQDLGD